MPKIKAKPGNPGLVVPAEDAIPARTHKGFQPSTGIGGRGSLVSPQNDEARGEGAQERGSQQGFKGPMQKGRVHATGPAEHVN